MSKKETNILAFLIFIIVCAMSSCSKSNDVQPPADEKTTVVFYSTNPAANSLGISVKLDAYNAAAVYYSASAPACGSGGFGTMKLKPGTYSLGYTKYPSTEPTKFVSITVAKSTTCQTFEVK